MGLKRSLTPLEARCLAVLVEKQHTVPDSYPLSLNALVLGCNQKTARDPVMNVSEAEALQALDGLKEQSLVNEVSGSRVVRFEHNAQRAIGVPSQSVAILALLMLRGPQTAAELRLTDGAQEDRTYDKAHQVSFRRRTRPVWLPDTPDPETFLEENREG